MVSRVIEVYNNNLSVTLRVWVDENYKVYPPGHNLHWFGELLSHDKIIADNLLWAQEPQNKKDFKAELKQNGDYYKGMMKDIYELFQEIKKIL